MERKGEGEMGLGRESENELEGFPWLLCLNLGTRAPLICIFSSGSFLNSCREPLN